MPRSWRTATPFATTSRDSWPGPIRRARSRSRPRCLPDRRLATEVARLLGCSATQPPGNRYDSNRTMTLTAEDRKADLVNRLATEARSRVSDDKADSAEQFVRRYFALVAPDDIIYT